MTIESQLVDERGRRPRAHSGVEQPAGHERAACNDEHHASDPADDQDVAKRKPKAAANPQTTHKDSLLRNDIKLATLADFKKNYPKLFLHFSSLSATQPDRIVWPASSIHFVLRQSGRGRWWRLRRERQVTAQYLTNASPCRDC
eukprot:TRINITY_DN3292_c0_g1_i2.p1 TRINITY_DN3292_c0_g1~~TRINITY_DN3292_c0_g1_i2.p1  ORF type:complete len:144 (+),score=13.23 TRINITY_DN3292_c0_g1_i2:800-1231(+)